MCVFLHWHLPFPSPSVFPFHSFYTCCFYTLPPNSGRVLWFNAGHPCVSLSILCPSVCGTSVVLSVICPSICSYFHFRTITSKCQWIFTKLGMCIDIVEIWFGIASKQISSVFDRIICQPHNSGRVVACVYFPFVLFSGRWQGLTCH